MNPARTCLVTGGSRGLGRAMVLGLLGAGHRVASVDQDAASLDQLAREFEDQPQVHERLFTLQADLSETAGCTEALGAAEHRFGQIEVLVNNAGIGQPAISPTYWTDPIKFWDVTADQWDRFFAINTRAGFLLARAVAPGMVARGWGRVVSITTSLDSMLRGGNTPYGATKAAVEAFTAMMADDLAATGVTANVLIPGGLTNTALINDSVPYDRAALLQPEVMVAPLLWLVSEEANAVSARRYICAHWDAGRPDGDPIAWRSLGAQMIGVPR